MSPTPCCDVTTPGKGRQTSFTICADHQAEGWIVDRDVHGPRLDKIRVHDCGCQILVSAGRAIEKCALHAIGWRACCLQATRPFCVCAENYSCPEHGDVHYGTHD